MWRWATAAGLLVLATTLLPWHDAVATTKTVGPILAFLVAVTVLAQLADAAGLFEVLARRAARLARGSTPALFLLVCALATITTALLSLDTTAVLLTPVVLALSAAVDVEALPFALAAVWLANAASLLLPISNLTNLLAIDALPGTTLDFARRMALPEVVAVGVVVLVLAVRFRRPLRGRHREPAAFVPADRPLFWLAALCCLAVAPASVLGLAPWKAAVPAAGVLACGFALRRRGVLRPALLPWRLVLFSEGLFLVVAALQAHGLGRLLTHVAGTGSLRPAVTGAVAGNLVNNLPAFLALQPAVPTGSLYGLLLGVDAGPMLLFTGSLATLLWRERCAARGLTVGAGQFLRLGLVVVPLLLLATWGALRVTG